MEFRAEIAIARTSHLPDTRIRPSRRRPSRRLTSLNRRKSVVRPAVLESTKRGNCTAYFLFPYPFFSLSLTTISRPRVIRGGFRGNIQEVEREIRYWLQFGFVFTDGRVNDLTRKIEGRDYFLFLLHVDHCLSFCLLSSLLPALFCGARFSRNRRGLAGLIKSRFFGGWIAMVHLWERSSKDVKDIALKINRAVR